MKFLPYSILTLILTSFSLTVSAQELNSGYIGINYWMPSWVSNGKIDQVWDQIGALKPELIRIGGNDTRGRYYGIEKHDKMLDQIELIGAIPLVQISGRWNKEQRLELLNHFKKTKRNIQYFSINNEDDDDKFDGWMDEAIQEHKDIAREIRSFFPDAIIAGPAFMGFDLQEIENHRVFLDAILNEKDQNGKYILNIYDIHSYTTSLSNSGDPIYDISTFKDRVSNILTILDKANAERSEVDKVSWTLSEFNISYRNEGLIWVNGKQYPVPETHKTFSFYAGQFWAQMFGYAIEEGAFAFIPWSIHESNGSRSALDIGMFDNNEPPFIPRSNYHHTFMLTNNLRVSSAPTYSSKEDVEVVALHDRSGTTVMVMNTGMNTYNLSLSLNAKVKPKEGLLVTVDTNTDTSLKVDLPPTSTKTFIFDAKGNLQKTIHYSKEDADNQKEPTVVMAE